MDLTPTACRVMLHGSFVQYLVQLFILSSLGGASPIYPLSKSIETDLTLDSLFDIFSFKSVRVEFILPHEIVLTVPGFRESWLKVGGENVQE